MAAGRGLDSPEMMALMDRLAAWPHGLGFLHLADLETVAIELRADPFLVAEAREALAVPDRRAILIREFREARARRKHPPLAAAPPAPSFAPPAEPVPSPLSAEALIEVARLDPLGLDFLLEGYPESVAVHFHVHPNVVFRARELAGGPPRGS